MKKAKARLMTAEELKEFVHHDYGYSSVQEAG